MQKYTLHYISPLSLFKFGFFIGLIVSFLPILFVILFLLNLASKLLEWLGGLVANPTIQLPIIGQIPVDINIVCISADCPINAAVSAFISSIGIS